MVPGAYAKIFWTRSLFLIFDLQLLNSLKFKSHLLVLFQHMRQFQSPVQAVILLSKTMLRKPSHGGTP